VCAKVPTRLVGISPSERVFIRAGDPDRFGGALRSIARISDPIESQSQPFLPVKKNDHENRIAASASRQYFWCLGFKYAIRNPDRCYYLTHTVVDWIDLFTRRELANIIVESLAYSIENKGLELNAWCLMPSHLHMIARTVEKNAQNLSEVMRDFKKFTSGKILQTIPKINESRRPWITRHFEIGSDDHQVWQEGMHPIELFSRKFTAQKLEYIHYNPVEAGIVDEPEHYLLSSARDYAGYRKGLLEIYFI
jgi:putative transposase